MYLYLYVFVYIYIVMYMCIYIYLFRLFLIYLLFTIAYCLHVVVTCFPISSIKQDINHHPLPTQTCIQNMFGHPQPMFDPRLKPEWRFQQVVLPRLMVPRWDLLILWQETKNENRSWVEIVVNHSLTNFIVIENIVISCYIHSQPMFQSCRGLWSLSHPDALDWAACFLII